MNRNKTRLGKPFYLLLFVCLASVSIITFYGEPKVNRSLSSSSGKDNNMSDHNLVTKTDEEWKEILSEKQFYILRKAGTERPFGEEYKEFSKQGKGKYLCAGCDTELFASDTKFDSKCGWPSFYDPANAKNVNTFEDYHLGYKRIEVRCAVCDGHLGHVFKGEGFDTPTDKRYCINGAILKFIPAEKPAESKKLGEE
jgi:peptide-methionine (R)-S-oxide reductase